jgi:small-conductance mechanosensitive channel
MIASNSILKRTDFLINEINDILRERLARKLFTLGPTPLNLDLWSLASKDLLDVVRKIYNEISNSLKDEEKRLEILHKLPLILLLLILGSIFLIIFYRRLFQRLVINLENDKAFNFNGWIFVCLNMARLLILTIAAFLLIEAIKLLGFFGFYEAPLIDSLTVLAISFIVTKWVGENLFSNQFIAQGSIDLGVNHEKSVSNILLILAACFALNTLLNNLNSKVFWSLETQAVLNFPLIIVSSIFLYKLSNFIKLRRTEDEIDAISNLSLLDSLGKLTKLVAVITPIIASSGYLFAAKSLIYPTLVSLILFAGSFIIFILSKEFILNILDNKDDMTEDSESGWALLPVIVAFIIFLGLIPLLALIWGAQKSDIYALWLKLNDGIPLGQARLTLTGIVSFLVVFSLGYAATKLIQRILKSNVLPKTRLDAGGKNALISGVGYSGIILSTMIAVSSTGLDLSSLAIVAGALSVGLGFGLQTIVSNFVSGIILLIERPIKEGDWIEVAGFSGTVRKISVRSTQIQTFDRGTVIVPNSELIAGSVLNYTHSNAMGRVKVPVGVAYGSDPRKVEKILLKVAENHPHTLKNPGPSVVFMGFGLDSLDFEIRAFMKDVGYVLAIKSDMNYQIIKEFEKAKIEIPFAQRDITIKNAEQLTQAFKSNLKK